MPGSLSLSPLLVSRPDCGTKLVADGRNARTAATHDRAPTSTRICPGSQDRGSSAATETMVSVDLRLVQLGECDTRLRDALGIKASVRVLLVCLPGRLIGMARERQVRQDSYIRQMVSTAISIMRRKISNSPPSMIAWQAKMRARVNQQFCPEASHSVART